MKQEEIKMTVLSEQEYEIKPFSHLSCCDPNYDVGKKYTVDAKLFHSNRKAGLLFQRVECDYGESHGKPLIGQEIRVVAYSARNGFGEDIVKAHKDGKYFPQEVKTVTDLDCETAQFDLCVDERMVNIQTGSDGQYGAYFHYKDNNAYILELMLSADCIDLERLKMDMAYVFDCKELQKELQQSADKKHSTERE